MIDISHESSIRQWDRLKQWVDAEAQSVKTYEQLAETALLHKEGKARYYHNPELQVALDWQQKETLNEIWAQRYHDAFDDVITFLRESRQAYEDEIAVEE